MGPHAAVADLYADLVNRYTGLCAPAPVTADMREETHCRTWAEAPHEGPPGARARSSAADS